MTDPGLEKQDRRGWLADAGRLVLLSGIGLFSWTVLARRPNGGCWRMAASCPTCRMLAGCELPQAVATRGARREEERTVCRTNP